MNIFKGTDGFEFYDDLVLNEKIEAMFADLMVLVEERNCFLSNELNSAEREFNRECSLINGFKETWAECSMRAYRCCDDPLGRLTTP